MASLYNSTGTTSSSYQWAYSGNPGSLIYDNYHKSYITGKEKRKEERAEKKPVNDRKEMELCVCTKHLWS